MEKRRAEYKEKKGIEKAKKIPEIKEWFEASNTRVVTYQQLIRDADVSYGNYLEKSKDKGRINRLLEAIEQHTSP